MKWERATQPPIPAEHDPADWVAPSTWGRLREVAWHLPRMLAGLGPLGPRGPEDGPPVLVLPGFLATDRTTMDLRRALARAGWRAYPWMLGINSGAKKNTLKLIRKRIEAIGHGQPVVLVGWSLGGLFAREVAHSYPELVRAVVTLGTPFSGDLKTNTNVREFYEWMAGHPVDQPPFERHPHKPSVPTLALWSRKDGIVAPGAARGQAGEADKAVEIDTSHMGFAVERPAMSRIVREIGTFLTEVEGVPPVAGPAPAAA